jgi:hypothetical protein
MCWCDIVGSCKARCEWMQLRCCYVLSCRIKSRGCGQISALIYALLLARVAKRVEVARRYMVQSGKNVPGSAQRGRRQSAVKHPSNPTTFGDLGTRRSLSELVLSTCLGCVESPMSECGGCSVKRRVVASSRHCVTTSSHCRIVALSHCL